MSKQITLSITVTEKMLKQIIKDADMEIVDKGRFAALFEDPKFAKKLVDDMLDVWLNAYEEDAGDGGDALAMLFDDCVDFAE